MIRRSIRVTWQRTRDLTNLEISLEAISRQRQGAWTAHFEIYFVCLWAAGPQHHYWTVILNQPPMSVVLPAHTLQWKMQCSISSVLRSEKLHNFGQLIIKLEIDNQNILSLMIGKTRTMWSLVANRCTQYFQNKLNPLMMSSLLMIYHMSSQCMLVSLLLMTGHTYLLFSEPHIVRLSIHFVLYIQV